MADIVGTIPSPSLSPGMKKALVVRAALGSNSLTAQRLFISKKAVERRLQRAKEKLGCRNTTHTICYAITLGIITPQDIIDNGGYYLAKRNGWYLDRMVKKG